MRHLRSDAYYSAEQVLLNKRQIYGGAPKPDCYHVTTRNVRRVEPMHFGCVELVKQHGSPRQARHFERVVSRRDVTSEVEFGLNGLDRREVILV